MSKLTLTVGAPSLNDGVSSHDTIQKALAATTFPLNVLFTNQMPFALSIPQGRGLFMKPVGHEGSEALISVSKLDEMMRIVSDIEAISSLNGFAQGVTVEFDHEEVAAKPVARSKTNTDATKVATDKVEG